MKKEFKLYFFSPESGGTWVKAYIYARTLKQAKKDIANIYNISERLVFEQ